jgi:hypothetical protein
MVCGMPLDMRTTALRATTGAILLTGLALRIYGYLRQPSMWTDEVAVTRNVIDRSLPQLISAPLDFGQVAPVGYLAVVKALVALFGRSELVLRLPALLASMAALLLFWRVAGRLAGGFAALTATALVAVCPMVLQQASQVKQYSSDFALSLLILLLAIWTWERRDCLFAIAAGGAAALWFSQHAILTAAGAGAALTLLCVMKHRATGCARRVAVILAAWGASAALSLFVSLHNLTPALTDYMRHFWASGFMPLHGWLPWVWDQLQDVFIQWNARPWQTGDLIPQLYALSAILGLVVIGQRRSEAALLPAFCIAIVIAVSAARWYPFPPLEAQRLILFESSLLVLLAAAAVEWLIRTVLRPTPGVAPLAAAIGLILFAVPTVRAVVHCPPPYKHDMTAEMLAAIRLRWQPGDILYANSGLALGVLYYAPQFALRADDIIAGECSPDPRTWLRELDRLRGRRVWVVVNNGRDQRRLLDLYLRTIGRRVDSIEIEGPGTWDSTLMRPDRPAGHPLCAAYDLRDPDPLASTNADRFEIPTALRFYDAPWWCFGVFRGYRR